MPLPGQKSWICLNKNECLPRYSSVHEIVFGTVTPGGVWMKHAFVQIFHGIIHCILVIHVNPF